MIPVSLSIEGLYSYQKKQTIDFQRLTQSQLFGIFGATGSGKSSILEAITLALYNECERLNRNLRNYNLMNLRSKELLVDFSFYLNEVDQSTYRFVVKGKRNSKQFDKVTYERQAYQLLQGSWNPLTLDTAESVLGLSYENFKRTVIIPQGRFREFIELKDTARSKMLNDIFGLDRFMFSHQTKSLIHKNNTDIARKEALLQKLSDITAEKLAQTQQQITEGTQILNIERKKLAEKDKIREQQERLRQWVTEIQQLEKELDELTQKKEEYNHREQQLNAYTQCLNLFREPLNRKQELAQSLRDIQEELQNQQKSIEELNQQLTQSRQSYRDVEESFQQRHKLQEKAEEYTRIITLKEQDKYLTHLSQRRENGMAKLAKTKEKRDQERSEIKTFEDKIQQLKSRLPKTQELMKMKDWWGKQQQLLDKQKEAQKAYEEIEEEISKAIERKRELISETFLDIRQYDLPTSQIIQLIHKEIGRLENQEKHTTQQYHEAQVKHQLEQLAGNLTPGEPCPLCGATDHPHPLNTSWIEMDMRNFQTRLDETRKHLNQLRPLIPLLEDLVKQAAALGQKKKAGIKLLEACNQNLEAHQANWQSGDISQSEEMIQESLKQYDQIHAELEDRERRLKALRDDLEDVEKKLQIYQQKLDEIQREYSEKLGKFLSEKASLKQLIYDEPCILSDEDLREHSLKVQEEYEQIGTLYRNLAQKIEDLKGRLKTHEGKRDAKKDDFREKTQKLARLNQELDQELDKSPFDSFQFIEKVLSLNLNIDAERQAIDQYKRTVTETQTHIAGLREQMSGQEFDLSAHDRLLAEIKELNQAIQAREQEVGAMKLLLENEQKQWKEKQELLNELEKLNNRAENLKLMANLFRGDGFVKFVSSAYLENLCITANERFMRLTHNALSLEVDENNQFHVRDRLNDGRIRSIRTLSGGQTFQAALCLALALADQVRQQAQARQNFFFLDEGFGSLDKDSLRLIFQTLQTLRKEDRIIGIISHVEDLQQEIETFLSIHNDPELGSQVRGSWQ